MTNAHFKVTEKPSGEGSGVLLCISQFSYAYHEGNRPSPTQESKAIEVLAKHLCREFRHKAIKKYPSAKLLGLTIEDKGAGGFYGTLVSEVQNEPSTQHIEESPELEDDLNEDLGSCDWDGPEDCESCT